MHVNIIPRNNGPTETNTILNLVATGILGTVHRLHTCNYIGENVCDVPRITTVKFQCSSVHYCNVLYTSYYCKFMTDRKAY